MYAALLTVHSLLRYPLLGIGLWLLFAAVSGHRAGRVYSDSQARWHRIFLGALDTQLTLGLLLYFALSPIAAAAMQDMGAAMKDPALRFFGVEHITTMFIAVAVAHIGKVRAGRAAPELRQRTVLRFQLGWLVLTVAAIPWPGLDVARPLLRF